MRKKQASQQLFLLVCGMAGGLLLGEGTIRLYLMFQNSSEQLQISKNSKVVVEPKPSRTYKSPQGQEVRVNRHGLKGEEVTPRKPNEYRILAVGDSIMAGEYLPEEERLPNLLSRQIAKKTGKEARVWNAAVGGYNSLQVLGTLEGKAPNVDPDLILIGVCANDYISTNYKVYQIGNRVFIRGRDGSVARHFNFLYQRSDLYKWLYDKMHERNLSRVISRQGYSTYLKEYTLEMDAADLKRWGEALDQMVQKAEEIGAEALFIFFPLHPQVYRGEVAVDERLITWMNERKYPFVDLSGVFEQKDPTGMTLYRERDIVHPNATAFEIASEAILGALHVPYGMRDSL